VGVGVGEAVGEAVAPGLALPDGRAVGAPEGAAVELAPGKGVLFIAPLLHPPTATAAKKSKIEGAVLNRIPLQA
jgi:hypothetical protein